MRLHDDLIKELKLCGWSVTRHKGEQNYLAWYDEMWVLESRWSPNGFTFF